MATQVWTVVEMESELLPWMGLFESREACVEAIDDAIVDIFGRDDFDARSIEWDEPEVHGDDPCKCVVRGHTATDSQWVLTRHS